MNQTIRELYDRKSVRVYADREISEEDRNLILESATMAPTAGNQQLYTIIHVTDQKKKELLAESCDHQPFITEAKMVLIFCADYLKWYRAYVCAGAEPRKPDVGDFLLAVEDAAIAAQNAVVAAHSLGIGSCYIGDIMENYEVQKEILGLPDHIFPAVMLVFRYPTRQQLERKKPERVPLSSIVYENSYPALEEEEIRAIFSEKTGDDFDGYMQRFCKRKYNSDFSREMQRSVRTFLENSFGGGI